MADLVVQKISLSGLDPSYTPGSAEGHEFINNGRTFIYVANLNGTLYRSVFIESPGKCSFGYNHNIEIIIDANCARRIGPFPMGRFNDIYGKVHVTYSLGIDMEIVAMELP